jgi:hypothetical protein
MAVSQQNSGFPPIAGVERSYQENLRAVMNLMVPGEGIRQGLTLGLPLSGGQPTTGLTPTLTNGALIKGDRILAPYSKVVLAATAGWANKKFYFSGTGGYAYYADAPEHPNDALIAEISTDSANPASIVAIAQPYAYGGLHFGVKGVVNVAKATDGADVNLFTWNKPANVGLDNTRITFAMVKTAIAVSAGNTSGDDFLLKVGSTTLATLASTDLAAAGNTVVGTPAASWVFGASTSSLTFKYNQTDTSTAIAGGAVEFAVRIECF